MKNLEVRFIIGVILNKWETIDKLEAIEYSIVINLNSQSIVNNGLIKYNRTSGNVCMRF